MTCSAKPLLLILLPAACLLGSGCQRSVTGPLASGPFAPAGTAVQSGSVPLIPLGPVSGATRVPPPATGSSSSSNSYMGTPSAANFGGGAALASTPGGFSGGAVVSTGWPANPSVAPADSFRSTLGGMNVIDLTNQDPLPSNPYLADPMVASYPAPPIGSGVAYPSGHAVQVSPAGLQPADLLRPIDQPYAAVPVPRYRGMEDLSQQQPPPPPFNSGVRPAGGLSGLPSDAWQTVQPVAAQAISTRPATSSASPGPSTEPAIRTANPSLPWRSPTTAR